MSVVASAQTIASARSVDGSVPSIVSQATSVGSTDAGTMLHIAVSLKARDFAGLKQFADDVSNPQSLQYRQYLTPDQIGEQFGAPADEVDRVVSFLRSNGMKVTLISPSRLAVLADCTVGQASRAFGVKFRNMVAPRWDQPGGVVFHTNVTPVKVPSGMPSVFSVDGLEDYTLPMPRATTTTLNPTQTRGAYNTAPMYGSGFRGQGATIAVSNWDGFKLSNAQKYITTYGLPVPAGGALSNISVVTIDGGSQGGRAQGEGDLDIQMELGMAPLANIVIYDGRGGDLINVLTREQTDNVAVVSESYGWRLDTATANAANQIHVAMSAQGMTYMAASGDSGTNLEPYSYPDYDPEVLQVGGTVATVDTTTLLRTSEVGWSGSGGGWSTTNVPFNTEPGYQLSAGLPNIGKRLVPDVALHASGKSAGAYFFVFRGSVTGGYVGTSFASPVFAGCIGVIEGKVGHRYGRMQNALYAQKSASYWHDITSGSNGNLPNGSPSNAGAGWDYVTGLGSLDFTAFATANP